MFCRSAFAPIALFSLTFCVACGTNTPASAGKGTANTDVSADADAGLDSIDSTGNSAETAATDVPVADVPNTDVPGADQPIADDLPPDIVATDSGPIACASDKQCAASNQLCDTTAGKCVDCNVASDCPKDFDCKAHKCSPPAQKCASTKDCPVDQVCDKTAGKCVGCLTAADCNAKQYCTENTCVDWVCAAGTSGCGSPSSVHACKSDGSGYTDSACPAQSVCESTDVTATCKAIVCTPGANVCDGNNVVTCNANGTATVAGKTCGDKEACVAGTCVAQTCLPGKIVCADGSHSGICNVTGTGIDGVTSCDDSDLCTSDSCQGDSGCVHLPGALTCSDTEPCTTDSCDPKLGCQFPAASTGTCDDGNACTDKDGCTAGKCAGTVINCDDSNVCTTDSCDDKTGCSYKPNDGKACNADDDACTPLDVCAASKCVAGAKKSCADQGPCIAATCDKATGNCSFAAILGACDDGDPCTSGDACKDGVCNSGVSKICDDKNPCTTDACDKKSGDCAYAPGTFACDDGNPCTSGDTCGGGQCTGQAIDAAKVCDDKNVCTKDVCSPISGCVHSNADGPCDDGNACTVNDICAGGVCTPGSNAGCQCQIDGDCASKEDGNLCNGTLFCDVSIPAAKACKIKPGSIVTCDAGKDTACATAQCAPLTGQCGMVNKTDAIPCNDSSLCTSGDACKTGLCTGTQANCEDNNPCTTDSCAADKGCVHAPASGPGCDDGDVCTTSDTCANGICKGAAKNCDDANACTTDSCDKSLGCQHVNTTAACDDGNGCTVGDACSGGTCKGTAKNCDDASSCTDDACTAPAGTCTHTQNGSCAVVASACGGNSDCVKGVCYMAKHVCVACVQNSDCGVGSMCEKQQCVPEKACASDNDCKATVQVCNKAVSLCVDCNLAIDCAANQQCVQSQCVNSAACVSSKQCPGGVCDTSKGVCVECLSNLDCAVGTYCTQWSECKPVICTKQTCAGAGLYACAADGSGYTLAKTCDDGTSVPMTSAICSKVAL